MTSPGRSVERDAKRLEAWAKSYRKKIARRWDKAKSAYQCFWEPGIDDIEALRRRELVVHLVHNFKKPHLARPDAAFGRPFPATVTLSGLRPRVTRS
jgi:hypothetical protein